MDKAWAEITEGAAIRIPRIFYYMIKYVTPVSLGILLIVWTYQAGFDLLLLRNANPEDIPYLLLTRGIILGCLLIGVFLVRRGSQAWADVPSQN